MFVPSLSFKLPTALSRQARPAHWPNGASPTQRVTASREGRRETMAASLILPERALPGLPLGPHEVRGQTLPSRGCGALRNPTASLASKDSRPPLGLCQPQRFRATPPCLGAPSGESAASPPCLPTRPGHQQNPRSSAPLAASPPSKKSSPRRREQAPPSGNTCAGPGIVHTTATSNSKPPSQSLSDSTEMPPPSKESSAQSWKLPETLVCRQCASSGVLADGRRNRRVLGDAAACARGGPRRGPLHTHGLGPGRHTAVCPGSQITPSALLASHPDI